MGVFFFLTMQILLKIKHFFNDFSKLNCLLIALFWSESDHFYRCNRKSDEIMRIKKTGNHCITPFLNLLFYAFSSFGFIEARYIERI